MTEIFVFGSNLKGIHGAGAAKHARFNYGAKLGEGLGRTGNAYGIATKINPTMKPEDVVDLETIHLQVKEFLLYAETHPYDTFIIARIGCGLAGYKDHQIAPMFKGAPSNCRFDPKWEPYV